MNDLSKDGIALLCGLLLAFAIRFGLFAGSSSELSGLAEVAVTKSQRFETNTNLNEKSQSSSQKDQLQTVEKKQLIPEVSVKLSLYPQNQWHKFPVAWVKKTGAIFTLVGEYPLTISRSVELALKLSGPEAQALADFLNATRREWGKLIASQARKIDSQNWVILRSAERRAFTAKYLAALTAKMGVERSALFQLLTAKESDRYYGDKELKFLVIDATHIKFCSSDFDEVSISAIALEEHNHPDSPWLPFFKRVSTNIQ